MLGLDNAIDWLYHDAVSREATCFYVAPWFALHLLVLADAIQAFAGFCLEQLYSPFPRPSPPLPYRQLYTK